MKCEISLKKKLSREVLIQFTFLLGNANFLAVILIQHDQYFLCYWLITSIQVRSAEVSCPHVARQDLSKSALKQMNQHDTWSYYFQGGHQLQPLYFFCYRILVTSVQEGISLNLVSVAVLAGNYLTRLYGVTFKLKEKEHGEEGWFKGVQLNSVHPRIVIYLRGRSRKGGRGQKVEEILFFMLTRSGGHKSPLRTETALRTWHRF